jgi:hypothetical protein
MTPLVYPIKQYVKALIVIGFAGLLIIIGHPVLAEQSQEAEQQKCVAYLEKCFSPEDYEYIDDFSTLTTGECFAVCKSTYDKDYDCGFEKCFEICKVASGNSKNACPIPADALE